MVIKTFDAFTRLSFMNINRYTNFLFDNLEIYEESRSAIRQSIKYAAKELPGLGGYVFAMENDNEVLGVVVVNRTGMNEYLSENIIVYVAVDKAYRRKGIGKKLIKHAINYCKGNVAIHIKFDSPAIKLFESLGFNCRNIEMRLER